jgi:glc operon protein GlcG
MYKALSMMLVITACVLQSVAAHAQAPAPAPVPEALPFDIPYGTPITLDSAKKVAEVAAAEAKRRNWKMAIAIVNPSGDLVYFEKADDTQLASVELAQIKAKAAAGFRRATKVFFDAMESGHPYVATLKGMIGAEGGIPLVENGKLVGAIGVGGGTGAQDGVVAKAGSDTVK